MENLNVQKPLRTGTGAIRVSHIFPDARRTRIPPASDCFLGFGDGKVYILFECLFSLLLIVGFVLAGFVFCES